MVGLRVVIGFQDKLTVARTEDILRTLGCVVVGKAYDEYGCTQIIRATEPDFVILEGSRRFLELAKTIEESLISPLLLLVGREGLLAVEREIAEWSFDCLEQPARSEVLRFKIEMCREKYLKKCDDVELARQVTSANATRNIVNLAKNILMQKSEVSEMQAILRLQFESDSKGIPLRETAKAVIRNGRVGRTQTRRQKLG